MDLRVSPPLGITGLGRQNQHAPSPRTSPGTTATAPSSRILLDIPCKVCKDHSSGKHYGIFACDGCAGFFKRSIRRNRQYICKAKEEGKCLVDKTHRNQCRACRLVKCLEAGMNKEAVQHERGPRNSTIRRQMSLLMKDSMDLAAMGHHATSQQLNPSTSPHQTIPNHQTSPATFMHHFGVPPHAAFHHLERNSASPAFSSHPFSRMPSLPGPPGFPHQFPHHLNVGGQTPMISSASTVPRNGIPSHLGANSFLAAAMAASVSGTIPVFPGSGQIPSPQHNSARPSPFSFMPAMSRYPVIKPEDRASPPPAPQTPPQQQTTGVPVSNFGSPVMGSHVPSLALLTPPSAAPLLRDVEIICESAARLLFLNVQWAKSLPAFLGLPSKDQHLLLEESWRELFILSAAQFLLPFEMTSLMANAGFTADSVVAAANAAVQSNKTSKQDQSIDEVPSGASSRASSASPPPSPASSSSSCRKRRFSGEEDAPKHPKKAMVARSLAESESEAESEEAGTKPPAAQEADVLTTLNEIRVLRDVLDQLRQMHVDSTEYACLKAIVLFKTAFSAASAKNLHNLKEPSTVSGLQDQAQLTLCKYIAAAHPTEPFRFGKLLLMLPTLRTVSGHTISRLFFQKTIGFTPIEKLVCDMYKSSPEL